MKLTNALVTKTSQNLDKATDGINAVRNEISSQVMAWLRDDKATEVFLAWMTVNAKVVKDETKAEAEVRRQSGKNFQNIVNQTTFQREYFATPKGETLSEELRVKKAKLPMVAKGDASQEQVDSKQVFKFNRKLDVTPATAKSDFDKFMAKWKLSTKQVVSMANATA